MDQTNRNFVFRWFRDLNRRLYESQIKTPAYLDLDTFFPGHRVLESNWETIKDEITSVIDAGVSIPKFHEIHDGQSYISNNDGVPWKLLNLKLYDLWHPTNKNLFPKTLKIISPIKNVKGIYFSILSPGKHIPPHVGPYKGIVRYQLAISVPKKGECKLIVDGKSYFWKEGRGVIFDDTYVHEVVNNTEETRVALLLDVRREVPGFFMRIYDSVLFSLIKLIIILNGTFKKSVVS